MRRMEYKFLVPVRFMEKIRRELLFFTCRDGYLPQETSDYIVRSVYFDTYRLQFYHEKIQGLLYRKKLRIRAYDCGDSESLVFLEIKRKWENYVWKNRAPIYLKDVTEFLEEGNPDLVVENLKGFKEARRNAEYFLHHVFRSNLIPTALVVYDREPLIGNYNSDLRITLDKNLRYRLFPKTTDMFSDDFSQIVMNDFFILEVKFLDGFPGWLNRLIHKYQLYRQALSKYTICLESERYFGVMHRRNVLAFI